MFLSLMRSSLCYSVSFRVWSFRVLLTAILAYLRLNGVKAREHPVFKELTRVKQYFDKIKAAETPAAERNLKVDRKAAERFIKAGLVCGPLCGRNATKGQSRY